MAKENASILLDGVTYPEDIRRFTVEQLKQLSEELRQETIEVVSITGGHLGASLGVIELTVVLHHVFNTPRDRCLREPLALVMFFDCIGTVVGRHVGILTPGKVQHDWTD